MNHQIYLFVWGLNIVGCCSSIEEKKSTSARVPVFGTVGTGALVEAEGCGFSVEGGFSKVVACVYRSSAYQLEIQLETHTGLGLFHPGVCGGPSIAICSLFISFILDSILFKIRIFKIFLESTSQRYRRLREISNLSDEIMGRTLHVSNLVSER